MTIRRLPKALLILALALASGCGGDSDSTEPDLTTAEGILTSLQESYRRKDVAGYADLLSDDFRFYFEPEARADGVFPEYWTKSEDLSSTARLMTSPRVRRILIDLSYEEAVPAQELGRESWYRDPITNTLLEVVLSPTEQEPEETTFRISDQRQTLYLRKGKNPGDTLPTSPTAERFYIVEWHDHGREHFAVSELSEAPVPVTSFTWSDLKWWFKP